MEVRAGLKKAASVILALAIWQIAAMLLGNSLLLVTPLTVIKRLFFLVSEPGFLSSVSFSFLRIASGFLLALAAGSLLAIIAGRYSFAEMILWPFIATIKSVPVASFIILCLIWLSSKNLSVFISFLIVLPIIYQNTLQGIKSTDKKLLEMAAVFRIGLFRRLKYIHIPNIKPYLISACSVSIGMSWKAGIAAEVIGIPDGSIGKRLYEAKIYLNSGDLFAWTTVIVAISIAFEKLFLFLLKKAYVLLEKSL
ncbi:MAG: ABC transporter permease subunit [Clostridiales bacterium]|jgi:NitT/TauT family transport system permease protein|nr:ABC transporter permease subunit [Clostridiales bacterium]